MKQTWLIAIVAGSLAAAAGAADEAVLKTQQDKDSYAVGADLGRNLKGRDVQIEIEPLLQGMRDVLVGSKLVMNEEELRKTLRAWQDQMRRKRLQTTAGELGNVGQENLEKGAAFLAQNQTNAGVVTLPSGLQYKIVKAGTGRSPSATDTVECHHRSMFIDGHEYNTTYRVGTPATLKVNEAVAGWKEALPLMPVGSKWLLYIPPQLAYGEKGVVSARGRTTIGPNTTLVCELELLAIK